MEHPFPVDVYYQSGMAFSAAGDFSSALTAFGRGISYYPNNSRLQYSYRLAFQCLPGTRRAAQMGVHGYRGRRARKYDGIDAPVNLDAMRHYYNAVSSFSRKDYSKAMTYYAEALKLDRDNKHLLNGYRESIVRWYKDCVTFHSYERA